MYPDCLNANLIEDKSSFFGVSPRIGATLVGQTNPQATTNAPKTDANTQIGVGNPRIGVSSQSQSPSQSTTNTTASTASDSKPESPKFNAPKLSVDTSKLKDAKVSDKEDSKKKDEESKEEDDDNKILGMPKGLAIGLGVSLLLIGGYFAYKKFKK